MSDGAKVLDLEAIKARVGRAMDGPWDYNPDAKSTESSPGLTGYRDGAPCPVFTSTAFWSHSDGVFVAAARADVPALVAEVERLRAREGQLEAALEQSRATSRALRNGVEIPF